MSRDQLEGLAAFYRGRKVLITGHTGFKGAWLAEWLLGWSTDVAGIGLPPIDPPSLFDVLGLDRRVQHHELDLLDRAGLARVVRRLRPDVVVHLAAQSLVRESYRDPLRTLDTNVTGTANLFAAIDAAGYSPSAPCAVVCVTSDKCYRNDESGQPCGEGSPMGGADLYSASKAMVELLAAAWRQSFHDPRHSVPAVRIATARAGNVIGGGDRAKDRIVVDAVAALAGKRPIAVRSPHAVRPWQHVLDPLAGYLRLGERLFTAPGTTEAGWNFGPGPHGERTVGELCDALVRAWGSGSWRATPAAGAVHEATLLRLANQKARNGLGWRPTWDFPTAVQRTVEWYRLAAETGHDPTRLQELTRAQIAAFTAAATRITPRSVRRSGLCAVNTGKETR
jgi:CDP-glucose 4,6-dehydratase